MRRRIPEGRFRGFTAPASLKAGTLAEVKAALEAFPGLYRPGLIEGGSDAGGRHRRGWFPGLYRPGLIEGIARAGREHGIRIVSGALPPRPH